MYYEYQRWYDPSIGRFISQDPLSGVLSDPQSLNRYAYARDSPTVMTDPSGADWHCVIPTECGGPSPIVNMCTTGDCNPEICADNPFICGGYSFTDLNDEGQCIGTTTQPTGETLEATEQVPVAQLAQGLDKKNIKQFQTLVERATSTPVIENRGWQTVGEAELSWSDHADRQNQERTME